MAEFNFVFVNVLSKLNLMSDTGFRHSIKVVSERTGLSPHLIRIWEKRYGIVHPERSGGNQRLYREEHIERLNLLRQATEAGHSIRNLAHLSPAELQSLVDHSKRSSPAQTEPPGSFLAHKRSQPLREGRSGPQLIQAAMEAISAMDAAELERVLDEGAMSLGQVALLSQVVAPLVQQIGDGWQAGTLKVAHEHLASAVIRTFLGNAARPFAIHMSAPMLIATTPSGQIHEMGAALAAAAAANQGWRVTYLGASLPAEEIASAAFQSQSRAVALSIVHPADDAQLPRELKRLRQLLPRETSILVGGAAASAYRKTLDTIGATVCTSLSELAQALDRLRQGEN